MSGPEHYAEAERCIGLGQREEDGRLQAVYFAAAQAHATLALAAATVMPNNAISAWVEALS